MKTPKITEISAPNILSAAAKFSTNGNLEYSTDKLSFLNISDAYINDLYPLVQDKSIQKPDYFKPGYAGAHISLIYPWENRKLPEHLLNKEYNFTINKFVAAEIGKKTYYVLLVDSPPLLLIRKQLGLTEELDFKGYAIGLHITIGTKECKEFT